MTTSELVALSGLAFTAVLALFGAGVAWGALKTKSAADDERFKKVDERIQRIEEQRAQNTPDVIRAELQGLRTYLDAKFEEMDRRIDRLER